MNPSQRSETKAHLEVLFTYLVPQKFLVAILLFLLIGNIVLQLVSPQIIGVFLDVAKAGKAVSTLLELSLAFIGIAIVQQGIAIFSNYFGKTIGWQTTNAMRLDLFQHCLSLDLAFHHQNQSGELLEKIDGDVNELADFFSLFAVKVFSNLLLMVGVIGVLAFKDYRLGGAFLLFSLLGMLLFKRTGKVAIPAFMKMREAKGKLYGFLGEHLDLREDIRSNGAEPFVLDRFQKKLGDLYQAVVKGMVKILFPQYIGIIVYSAGQVMAVALGYFMFTEGLISMGYVVVIIFYMNLLLGPIQELVPQLTNLQKATAALNRISLLFSEISAIPNLPHSTLPKGPLALKFQNVGFGYHPTQKVLKDLSFSLEAGKCLGILGKTGSGKSTITRLIFRLNDVDEGMVLLGGLDHRQVDLNHLRSRLGMVSQEIQIFNTTVRENLRLYDLTISDDQIVKVLQKVGLESWLNTLSKGLDSIITAKGSNLSAGQAQLLGLGRVFLKKRDLVILDEPTSKISPASEDLITKAIRTLQQESTCVVIAHHLKTVENADYILILEDGRIIEYGEEKVLRLQDTSHYAQLLKDYHRTHAT